MTFADHTTTYVDAKYLTNQGTSFITTDDSTKESGVSLGKDSQFVITGVQTGETLNFSNSNDLTNTLAKEGQITTDNALQKFVEDKDDSSGKLVASVVTKEEAAAALPGSVLTNAALEAAETNNEAITDLFTGAMTTAEKVANLNKAANLGELAGLNHSTYTASNLFTDTIGKHLEVLPKDKELWGYYVHSKESVGGLGLAGASANYDTTYDGAVVGMDLWRKGNTAGGVAISYINGSLEGAGIKNDADYYGLSVYGRKDLAGVSLLSDVSYLHGSNDITQTLVGKTVTAKPDADGFTVGIKALKDIAVTGTGKLTPYAGVRYLRINTESYSASNGLHYDADSQDLFLIPVGVNYSADFTHGAWTYRPTVGVGYVWNAAGRSVDQTVSWGNGIDSFSYNTIDSSSFIAHAGISAEKKNISFGVGYEYQDGSSTRADKWMVNAAYRF